MSHIIHHKFTCDVCGLTIKRQSCCEEYPAHPGYVTSDQLPKGWFYLGRQTICHRHSIYAAAGSTPMSMLTSIRKGSRDDEAGYTPDEFEAFENDPKKATVGTAIWTQMPHIVNDLHEAAMDPLSHMQINTPPKRDTAKQQEVGTKTPDRFVCMQCGSAWCSPYSFCPHCGRKLDQLPTFELSGFREGSAESHKSTANFSKQTQPAAEVEIKYGLPKGILQGGVK